MDETISKSKFRREALRRRAAIEQREEKSAQIAARLFETNAYKEAKKVFCYVSYKSEADTAEVCRRTLEDKKILAVPRVTGRDMVFCRIGDTSDLHAGAHGIQEPDEGCPAEEPDGHTLIIVPGCAFDEKCRRMGYGGGYYDRYLARWPEAATVGYAFEEQIFDAVPCGKYDVAPDMVVTEREIRFRKEQCE